MITEDRRLASKTACKWSPNTGKESNSLPIDCPGVSYLVWSNYFGRAVNDAFKKNKIEDSLTNSARSQFPSRCHAHTKHCIAFHGSFAHVHLNLFLSSSNLLIPSRTRKAKHACSTTEAPCIGSTVDFILKCKNVGDVMWHNT